MLGQRLEEPAAGAGGKIGSRCMSFESFTQDCPPTHETLRREMSVMEQKKARLTVLIDPTKKAAFEQLCAVQDVTPSQVVRQMIREYLEKHGVSYANQPKHPGDGA